MRDQYASQDEVFRLETRAREFIFMASLRVKSPKAKGNRVSTATLCGEGEGLKGPLAMGVRLETGRSCPEQNEAGRKPSGGSKGC